MGPSKFKKLRAAPYSTKSEKVHTAFLRIMVGASKSTCVQGPASYPAHVSLGDTCGALVEQDVCI
jgi:hypothetical protein